MTDDMNDGIPLNITTTVQSLTEQFDEALTTVDDDIKVAANDSQTTTDAEAVTTATPIPLIEEPPTPPTLGISPRSQTRRVTPAPVKPPTTPSPSLPSRLKPPSTPTSSSRQASPGHRLYARHAQIQSKLAEKRKEKLSGEVDTNPYSPVLVSRNKSVRAKSLPPHSPSAGNVHDRLYNLSKNKKKQSPKPAEDNVSVHTSGTKISVSKAANLYDRGLTHLARKEMKMDDLVKTLTPTFSPQLSAKQKVEASPPVNERLYNPNWKKDREAKSLVLKDEEMRHYTFAPEMKTKKSPTTPHPPEKTDRWKRLYELSATKKRVATPPADETYSFRPNIQKSQANVMAYNTSSVYERLKAKGDVVAEKHIAERLQGETKGVAETKVTPKRRMVGGSARIEQLYQSGKEKAQILKNYEKAAKERDNPEDLEQCTFQPRTKWGGKQRRASQSPQKSKAPRTPTSSLPQDMPSPYPPVSVPVDEVHVSNHGDDANSFVGSELGKDEVYNGGVVTTEEVPVTEEEGEDVLESGAAVTPAEFDEVY